VNTARVGPRTGPARERALADAVMIAGTSLSIQLAAAIAHDLCARLGPAGTSALRFALGAPILLAVARPAIRGRDAATWAAIAAYGASLAALNLTFFQAISMIPMGVAVTLSFAGPLVMALAGSRRRRDVVWVLLAAAGVTTLGGTGRPGSIPGMLFAVAAEIAWIAVACTGRSVGRRTRRVDGLALAIPVAALITVPLGLAAGHLGAAGPGSLAIGLAIAVGGLIIPFTLELEGLRRLDPPAVAIIYSLDPAIAAIVGLIALGQHLQVPQILGSGTRPPAPRAPRGKSASETYLYCHNRGVFGPPGRFSSSQARFHAEMEAEERKQNEKARSRSLPRFPGWRPARRPRCAFPHCRLPLRRCRACRPGGPPADRRGH
jgi:inner membrane transporter RhtA